LPSPFLYSKRGCPRASKASIRGSVPMAATRLGSPCTRLHEGGGIMRDRDDDIPSNKSGNRPFNSVLTSYKTRRQVLRGGLESAAAAFFATSPALAVAGAKGKGRGK